MKTKIVCAFPTMGKSHYHKEHPDTTLDSDSSEYSWVRFNDGKKMRNSKFPNNYISHIKEEYKSGKYEYIFVSTHKDVIQGLIDNNIEFYIVYPPDGYKDVVLATMKTRGSNTMLINTIDTNYDAFIDDIKSVSSGLCIKITTDLFITDLIEGGQL